MFDGFEGPVAVEGAAEGGFEGGANAVVFAQGWALSSK